VFTALTQQNISDGALHATLTSVEAMEVPDLCQHDSIAYSRVGPLAKWVAQYSIFCASSSGHLTATPDAKSATVISIEDKFDKVRQAIVHHQDQGGGIVSATLIVSAAHIEWRTFRHVNDNQHTCQTNQ
jgi:hypothetical protein